MSKWWKLVLLPLMLATVLFGILYAQQVETVSTIVVLQSDGSARVQRWTAIEGTVGTITTPGGLVYVAVPAGGVEPPGTWTIAVYLRNPAVLNDAYSFLNMEIEVQTPLDVAHTWPGTVQHSALLNPDKGYVVFSVLSSDGLPGKLVDGALTAVAAEEATLRIFSVGIGEGSFHTKRVAAPGNLAARFSVEVRSR